MNRRILLAYGEKEFTKRLKSVLEQRGHIVTILWEGSPPRAQYDQIVQLARDPTHLTEGTRLLLGKAKKDRSRLILLIYRLDEKLYEEAARFAQTLVEDAAHRNEIETVILNLGRIYGPGIPSHDSGALGHLVTEFSKGNVLTLYGEGKDRDYYLFTADALEGIALAVEKTDPDKTYALAPNVPINSEAIAKLLYELGGERHEISFHRGLSATPEKGEVPGKPLPGFKIKTPFHEGILAILRSAPLAPPARAEIRLPHLRLPLIRLPKISGRIRQPSPRTLRVAAIALIILSPILYLGGEVGLTALQLHRTKSALEGLDFRRARSAATSAAKGLARLGKLFPVARPWEEATHAMVDITSQGETLTTTLENIVKSREGESTQPQSAEDFRALATAFSSAENRFVTAWLESQTLDSKWLKVPTKKLRTFLDEGIRVTRLGRSLAKNAEDLLGYRGERNYLILFQNSTELRSTGGFFGSFAQLTLENGGIKKLEFFDSYQFQNAGKVPYHPAVRQLLRAEETPLYDVNVYPSFPNSARQIAVLFSQAQGIPVHGVWGTTLNFAQELLRVTGPLELAEFERTVNAENLFAVATEEREENFFPGTTRKKRLIQALGEELVERLFASSPSAYPNLARTVWESLNQRNLLFYFAHGEIATAIAEAGWDGKISAAPGDYLGVFDNNYSAKTNGVWVRRKIDYRVFSPDRSDIARGEATLTWEHTGTDAWPSSSYQNLVLILTPKGSKLMGAFLNGADFTNVFTYEEEGRTAFAALFWIPHSATTTFKITYELPAEFNFDRLERYHLTVQKQPGTAGDPFTFRFEPSIGQQAVSPSLQTENGRAVFEGNLERDLSFDLKIEKR